MSLLFILSLTFKVSIPFSYSSFSPILYIQDTEATIITSLLLINADVAACLISSISSLIDESFSIYVSLDGTYASG